VFLALLTVPDAKKCGAFRYTLKMVQLQIPAFSMRIGLTKKTIKTPL
jgi:hypothetical protein